MHKIETLLAELVALPSMSSENPRWDTSNLPVINRLAERLESMGFEAQVQPVSEGKANLIANIGRGSGGLILAGHTDTVPYDEKLWLSDPFKLDYREGNFYGLGSTDMKGFFAVVLAALSELADTQLASLERPLTIVATADEESSMSGARALSDADPLNARFAVIGEPTGLKPVNMHKGIMMESISLHGQSGHSSNPALGHNALDAMHKVIAALMTLREEWGKRYQNPGFEVAVPTLNLAAIHGGDAPNRICQHCKLTFDVRILPGMQNEEVRHWIQERVNGVLANSGVSASYDTLFQGVEPYLQQEDSELIQKVAQLTGHTAQSAGYATEAPFLQALGMQTVVLGPGSIDCAHQANEYFPADQIEPAITLIKNLVKHYCMQ